MYKRVTQANPISGLAGQVVFITGASSGIGKETALYLADQGCKLALFARQMTKVSKDFETYSNEDILFLTGDLTDINQITNAINKTVEKFGKLDVLINNAGVNAEKSIDEHTQGEIDTLIDTNVKGAIFASKAAIPHMKKAGAGTIITIGSKISRNTNVSPNKVLYTTTKYAVEGFAYALNKELKPYNIRSICLLPGTVNTFLSLKSGNYLSPKRLAEIIGMIISFHDVDFENFVVKSSQQDI